MFQYLYQVKGGRQIKIPLKSDSIKTEYGIDDESTAVGGSLLLLGKVVRLNFNEGDLTLGCMLS